MTCAQGHPSVAGDFCDVCGQPIAGADESQAAQPVSPHPAAVTACPTCGALRSGRFCENCGLDTGPAGEWVAVVSADRDFYDRVVARGEHDTVEYPPVFQERRISLRGKQILIGRQAGGASVAPDIDLGVQPADRGVSARHALLRLRETGPTITDLGSTNGTSLNGSEDLLGSDVETPLKDGDRIHIGAWTTITVARATAEEPAPDPGERTTRTSRGSFQLHRELRDAREQSASSREILSALARDVANPGAVLDTVVEYAARLCRARAAQLFLLSGDMFHVSRVSGETPEEYRRLLVAHPIARNRLSTVGRAAEDMCTHQVADVLADDDYGRLDLQRLAGFRTLLSTPMIVAGEVVGVLSMWRTEVAPFDARERDLLEEFAAQGAIVLRQVDLMRALESRGAELASKVAQLEALREVGEAVGSSLDLDEVLDQIVRNAVRLTNLGFGDITLGTDGGSILEYHESADSFDVRAAFGSSPELLAQLRQVTIDRDTTVVARTALQRRVLEIADIAEADPDPYLDVVLRDGWRSLLSVPMIRSDTLVGVLVIRRRGTGAFPPDVIEMLEAFASQSALAIVNARLFRELETKTRELEVAGRHKSEFLASMSHELRTPLNAVIGFSEVLLDRLFGEVNDRQDEYLRDIRNSGQHLLELINEILDLSKVEDGQMELEPSTFVVAGVVESALAMVRERAAQHGIGLTVHIGADVDLIEADERRFKQVLLNLLSNAVKFTPDGGSVTVRADRDGTELVVTVTDTGIGVPPEDQDRIFESFQQGGRGAPKEEGTGLGLTLSRRIVRLFGGRMWLESTVGAGSTFGFSVPGLPEPATAATARPDGTPVVLVLDEDRVSQDLVDAYLEPFPVDVLRAWDGAKAVDLIRAVRPVAVILEIGLSRMDGWQVLAALKADPATATMPVVIASTVDNRSRGLALGAAAYLLKPVRRDELVGALRSVGVLPTVEPA
ncbi:ATP-binding protein [Mycolicibacterium cosmeticum]|nr:ATP-binding protein [Mycolicibacterium cosmeticum]